MGTSINNGYRLAPGTDPFAFITTLRAVMDPIRDRLDAAALMERAVGAVDWSDRKGEPRPDLPLLDAMHALDAEQNRRSAKPLQRGYDPHRFEVCFARVSSGDLLALLYADEPDFVAAWEALAEVSDYSYDNRVDRPEGLPETDYARRTADWQEVMPEHAPPVMRTLGWKLRTDPAHDLSTLRLLMDRNEPETRALLEQVAPTLRTRARSIALDLLTAETKRRHPDADALRVVWSLMRADITPVVAVIEPLLHDDAVAYAIDGVGDPGPVGALVRARARARGEQIPPPPTAPSCPLDLTTVHSAVAAHLNLRAPGEEN